MTGAIKGTAHSHTPSSCRTCVLVFYFNFECVLLHLSLCVSVRVMTLNATFSNMSAILRKSVVLMEETGVSGENHKPVTSH